MMTPFLKSDPCPCRDCHYPDMCEIGVYGCYDLACWKDRVKEDSSNIAISGHTANFISSGRATTISSGFGKLHDQWESDKWDNPWWNRSTERSWKKHRRMQYHI